jgi:hypothetical protein
MFVAPILAMLLASPPAQADLVRYVYPLAKPVRSPKISIDVKEAPDLQAWAETARSLATSWFPQLCQLLATGDFKRPKSLRFVFRAEQDAPAYCAGDEISFSAEWVRKHPDDLGMVIHELTHVVQAYPANKNDVGWLVEGIADYTRWWRYEPEAPRTQIDFSKASYRDAYRTTAAWLAWTSQRYDLRLVPALDRNLRRAEDPMPTFVKFTGKTADLLWAEFRAASQPKR